MSTNAELRAALRGKTLPELRGLCAAQFDSIERAFGRRTAEEWESSVIEETAEELRAALVRSARLFTGEA